MNLFENLQLMEDVVDREKLKKDLLFIKREAEDMFKEDSSESMYYYLGYAAAMDMSIPITIPRNLLPDHVDVEDTEYQDFMRGVRDNMGNPLWTDDEY